MNTKEIRSLNLKFSPKDTNERHRILDKVRILQRMHKDGMLGGTVMPEDENPKLPIGSHSNYHYFTLPMPLNYQRNSYVLWQSARKTFDDPETRFLFKPVLVVSSSRDAVKAALQKYNLALQPEKQTDIWITICTTLCDRFDGDIRNLFRSCNFQIPEILERLYSDLKKGFPYLSGPKISNYWLYIIHRYTDAKLGGVDSLSIAPDRHILKASIKLGLIDGEFQESPTLQALVSDAWRDLLKDTNINPIDIHTPLWLWSRGGFLPITEST